MSNEVCQYTESSQLDSIPYQDKNMVDPETALHTEEDQEARHLHEVLYYMQPLSMAEESEV